MKQFFKMFFASLLAMVVAGIILVGVFIGSIVALVSSAKSSKKDLLVKDNSVLVIDLDKRLYDLGEGNSFAMLGGDHAYNAGLFDVTRAIAHARNDDKVKGILLKTGGTPNSWAGLQQLREALLDFKGSRKFVYAYGEDISQRDYFVASVADSIFLNPIGDMELKGIASQLAFFKGSLDKLGVQPEIFYAGKFKSATEPFRAEKISDANREQIMALQNGIWSQFLAAAAAHAGTDTATVHQWTTAGLIQFPQDALDKKLVDGLWYWDEVEARLKKRTGRKEDEKPVFIEVDDYTIAVSDDTKSENRVAILFAEGEIIDGLRNDDRQIASKTFVESIRKIRDNDKIKAVVLRVNSPGGSARASEVILRELQLLKKKKPLVVSMGDVAASGGYYIACQADSIFAMPNTITGSIGVFTMLFNLQPLMNNKLGVTFDAVKNAPYADFPTGSREMTADEKLRMQRSVDTIYAVFKRRVAAGRRISEADVDSIAQGRVWTGSDALRIGLVDALGGTDRALKAAAALAKISDYKVVTYPDPVDKLETLLRKFSNGSNSQAMIRSTLREELGSDYAWFLETQKLRGLNGKAQMLLPFRFTIE